MNTTDTMLATPLLKALGYSLIHFIWQGALVCLLLASVRVMLRKSGPGVRYTAACAAMLLMLALPIITAFTVARSSASFAALSNTQTKTRATVTLAQEAAATSMNATQAASSNESTTVSSVSTTLQEWTTAVSSWLTNERTQSLIPWLVSIWLAGVLLLSARVFGGWLMAQRLKRSMTRNAEELWQATVARLSNHLGIRRTVLLCESALAEVPTVIGWLRPVILVPVSALAGMSAQQVEALLAHELAHIRRHDYLVNLLQTVVETLLFYHPAVWWVSRQIRIEREHCCDDMAVAACGDVLVYARALTELEELRAGALPQLAVAANGGSLITRIRRLIEAPKPSAHRGATWLASLIALSTVFCIWAGAQSALIGKAKEIVKAKPFISSYFQPAKFQKEEKHGDCPLSNPNVIHDPQPVVVKVDIDEDDAVK
ncbi:MAG: M56 family metallopeptidase, partial [Pyrinomonadaceae bacterium]